VPPSGDRGYLVPTGVRDWRRRQGTVVWGKGKAQSREMEGGRGTTVSGLSTATFAIQGSILGGSLEWNSPCVWDHPIFSQVSYYLALQMSVAWESAITCLLELAWGLMDWEAVVADGALFTVLCWQSGCSHTGRRLSCCCRRSIGLALIRTGDLHGQAVPAPAGQFFWDAAFGGSCSGQPPKWTWPWCGSMLWSSRSSRRPVDFWRKDWGRDEEIGSLHHHQLSPDGPLSLGQMITS
jgi:hypothetical protein